MSLVNKTAKKLLETLIVETENDQRSLYADEVIFNLQDFESILEEFINVSMLANPSWKIPD